MAKRFSKQLTSIEREIVAEIKGRRQLPAGHPGRKSLDDPTDLVKYFIESKHGNAQLHVKAVIAELGVQRRTVQRNFVARYKTNVRDYQVHIRLEFALHLLGFFPATSIGKVAETLGYDEVRVFNRFFHDHMHMSPTEWCEREQKRTKRETDGDDLDSGSQTP